MQLPSPLVSAQWLKEHIGETGVKIVDGTWRLADGAASAREGFADAHLPDAVFFNLDVVSDQTSDLPHMLPSAEEFSEHAQALGLSNDDLIVIYDQDGIHSAPRVWWTFKAMGHDNVTVLDGGLPAWRATGGALTDGANAPALGRYQAQLRDDLIADHQTVRAALAAGETVLDARPSPRFDGKAPEPRAGLRSGAMPGARNLPSGQLLQDGRLAPVETLNALFDGLEQDAPVVTSCGSGVTAAIIVLALEQTGRANWRVYDGSWAEWGRADNDPALFPVVLKEGQSS